MTAIIIMSFMVIVIPVVVILWMFTLFMNKTDRVWIREETKKAINKTVESIEKGWE